MTAATKKIEKKVTTKKKYTPKMRIKFKSYDLKIIDATTAKVANLLIKSGAKIKWPIPLPRKRKLYTVLKAPFVHKDAREQFERITYSRIIDVISIGEKTVEYLKNLQVPVGVFVDIKLTDSLNK